MMDKLTLRERKGMKIVQLQVKLRDYKLSFLVISILQLVLLFQLSSTKLRKDERENFLIKCDKDKSYDWILFSFNISSL